MLKKYISVLAAVLMLGSYASFAAYAAPDDTTLPAESEDAEEEDPDEIIPIDEEAEDEEPDEEDIEFIDTEATIDDEPALVEPAATGAGPETDTPAPQTVPQYNAVSEYTMYATEVVNVRYGPDTSYSKFGTVYANTPVTVIGTSGSWLAIKYNGTTGFVSSGFFSSTAPETTTTTAAPVTEQTQQEETQPEDTQPDDVLMTPRETDAPEDEPILTSETTARTESTEETEETEDAAASVTDSDNKTGGIGGLLIALACAVGTFLLVGVLPVVIHKIYHNKLYQY